MNRNRVDFTRTATDSSGAFWLSIRTCCFILLAFAVLFGKPTATTAQTAPAIDKVFRSSPHRVAFRYPKTWVPQQPQLSTTIVLLYANDGSEATCNMNTAPLPELNGASEQKVDTLRKASHGREFFEKSLRKAFPGFSLLRYWRSHFGQEDAGAIEYRHELQINDTPIAMRAFAVATLANGRRYTLNCNAPLVKAESARRAFDYIRSTTLFMN